MSISFESSSVSILMTILEMNYFPRTLKIFWTFKTDFSHVMTNSLRF